MQFLRLCAGRLETVCFSNPQLLENNSPVISFILLHCTIQRWHLQSKPLSYYFTLCSIPVEFIIIGLRCCHCLNGSDTSSIFCILPISPTTCSKSLVLFHFIPHLSDFQIPTIFSLLFWNVFHQCLASWPHTWEHSIDPFFVWPFEIAAEEGGFRHTATDFMFSK